MDVARDLARWFFWTALRFERAYIAIELACTIQNRLALVHGAARSEPLSSRAVVDVAGRIISKVAAREGAIIPLRLVEHRDMWRDALLLDQPVQHRSCTVSGIADRPLRLEAKAPLCPLDHGLRRADLGLANGAGRLDIDDDAELHIDHIKGQTGAQGAPGPKGEKGDSGTSNIRAVQSDGAAVCEATETLVSVFYPGGGASDGTKCAMAPTIGPCLKKL